MYQSNCLDIIFLSPGSGYKEPTHTPVFGDCAGDKLKLRVSHPEVQRTKLDSAACDNRLLKHVPHCGLQLL